MTCFKLILAHRGCTRRKPVSHWQGVNALPPGNASLSGVCHDQCEYDKITGDTHTITGKSNWLITAPTVISNRLLCESNDKENDQKRNRDDDARYRQTRRSECPAAVIPQPHALPLHHIQVSAYLLLRGVQYRLVRRQRAREVLRVPPQPASHLRQLHFQLLLQRRAVLQRRRRRRCVAPRRRPIRRRKGTIRLVGRAEEQVHVRRGWGCGGLRILSCEKTGRDV